MAHIVLGNTLGQETGGTFDGVHRDVEDPGDGLHGHPLHLQLAPVPTTVVYQAPPIITVRMVLFN